MTDVSPNVVLASSLLFIGGALTALGIERIYKWARSNSTRTIVEDFGGEDN